MPFVHIELIKGRTDEQLTNSMKDVTEAVHKDTGAPKEHIHVIINELGKHSYGNSGEWRAQIQASSLSRSFFYASNKENDF